MKRLFVIVTTNNPDKATRAAQFAKLAGESLAGMILVDDAVYLAIPETLDRTKAVTGDDFAGHLNALPQVPLLVCKPCCAARGIVAEDLHPAFKIGTGVDAMAIVLQDDVTTLTF